MLKNVDPAPARIEFLQLSLCRCKNASSPTKAAVLDPVLEEFFATIVLQMQVQMHLQLYLQL